MTDDSKMPDEIYAWLNQGTFWSVSPDGVSAKTKYIRADLAGTRAPSDAARGEALDDLDYVYKAAKHGYSAESYKSEWVRKHHATIRAALHAPVPIKQDYADQRITNGKRQEALACINEMVEEILGMNEAEAGHTFKSAMHKGLQHVIRAALSSDREAELLAVIADLAGTFRENSAHPLLRKHAAIISAAQEGGSDG